MFKIPAKMPGMRGWLQGVCARGGSMKALAHVRTGSNAVVTRVPMVRAVAGSVLVRPGLAWPGFGLSGIGGGAGGARRMGEGMGKRAMSETAPVAPEIDTELDALPETIRRMLSLENASQMELNRHNMRAAIKDFQLHPSDTGSPEVQVAILTVRIAYMTKHAQTHRKDNHNKRGLVQMVNDRRKMLKYLRRESEERYFKLIERLGIRDTISLVPQRAFLPAEAAEAAAAKQRKRLQLKETERRQRELKKQKMEAQRNRILERNSEELARQEAELEQRRRNLERQS